MQNKVVQNPTAQPITLSDDDEDKGASKSRQNSVAQDGSTRPSSDRNHPSRITAKPAPHQRTRSPTKAYRAQSSSRRHGRQLNPQTGISPIRPSGGRKSPPRRSTNQLHPSSRFDNSRNYSHRDLGRLGEKRIHERSPSPHVKDRYPPKYPSHTDGRGNAQRFPEPTVASHQSSSGGRMDARGRWTSNNGDRLDKQGLSKEPSSSSTFSAAPHQGNLHPGQIARNQSSNQGIPSRFFFPPPNAGQPEFGQRSGPNGHPPVQRAPLGSKSSEFEQLRAPATCIMQPNQQSFRGTYGNMPTAKNQGGTSNYGGHPAQGSDVLANEGKKEEEPF